MLSIISFLKNIFSQVKPDIYQKLEKVTNTSVLIKKHLYISLSFQKSINFSKNYPFRKVKHKLYLYINFFKNSYTCWVIHPKYIVFFIFFTKNVKKHTSFCFKLSIFRKWGCFTKYIYRSCYNSKNTLIFYAFLKIILFRKKHKNLKWCFFIKKHCNFFKVKCFDKIILCFNTSYFFTKLF